MTTQAGTSALPEAKCGAGSVAERRSSALAVISFGATALATMLLTVAQFLWWPISMAAIERADNAGWDESLLLPNHFFLDVVILGAWALSLAAAVLTFAVMRRSRASV